MANVKKIIDEHKEKKCNDNPYAAAAGALGFFIVIAFTIASFTAYKIKAFDNTLTTTGSAKVQVTADLAKWRIDFSRTVTVNEMKEGIAQMEDDLKTIKDFLNDNGISESEYTVSTMFSNKVYDYYEKASGTKGPDKYSFNQTVEVKSNDISKVKAIANNTKPLFESGVFVNPGSPEYYYTPLAEKRIELIGEAVKDARKRAEMIAGSDNSKVGNLKSASIGVTQVMTPNSVDVSDYGTYDTSTEEKEIMLTVRAVFKIK